MSDPVAVEVYFDFTCPYVHSAAAWLREVNRQLGDSRIEVTWKFFPLDQVNAPADADMPIWNLPPTAAAVVVTAFTRRRRRADRVERRSSGSTPRC